MLLVARSTWRTDTDRRRRCIGDATAACAMLSIGRGVLAADLSGREALCRSCCCMMLGAGAAVSTALRDCVLLHQAFLLSGLTVARMTVRSTGTFWLSIKEDVWL